MDEEIRRQESPSALAAVGIWVRLILGLGLAAVGGMAFGQAWSGERDAAWWWGGLMLAAGVALVVWALPRKRRVVAAVVEPEPEVEEKAEQRETLVPLLGALLVYKYRRITHRQLAMALEKQKNSKPRRRLGDILLEERLVTVGQLEEALAYQRQALQERKAARS